MKPNRLVCTIGIIGLLCVPGSAWAQSNPDTLPESILPPMIPIFPLNDVVLFPNILRPLHIFEPRYRAMVTDALKGDRIIGMVLLQPGHEADYAGRPPVYPIGCAGVITDVEQLPDGRYAIVLRGLVKFRISGEDQSRVYRLARVEAMPEVLDDQDRAVLQMQRQRLEELLESIQPSSPPPALSDEDLVNGLAQFLDLHPINRQELLERKGPLSRSQALIELLERKLAPSR